MYKTILVPGGAGFVGSHICRHLRVLYPTARVVALDNLRRRGSELNIVRLRAAGVEFVHGDVRQRDDLVIGDKIDLLVECSAEPSVLAGYQDSPAYAIQTNLLGMVNCLELARRDRADVMFLSTSRVYPLARLQNLALEETATRFVLADQQTEIGVSDQGISEKFTLDGARSFYGTTKLSSEMLLQEYMHAYDLRGVINRCGVIAGPWQMGKTDQGFFALWLAKYLFGGELSYIGFGGHGKQVRDVLHIVDLCAALEIQLENLDKYTGQTFHVGGGAGNAISLKELSLLCEAKTGQARKVGSQATTRSADVPYYVSDCRKFTQLSGWQPRRSLEHIVDDIQGWMREYENELDHVFVVKA